MIFDLTRIYQAHSNQEALDKLFIGRKVVAVEIPYLYLDDGNRVKVIPNKGFNDGTLLGKFWIDSLNAFDHPIDSVAVGCYERNGFSSYRMYVNSEDPFKVGRLLSVNGTSGDKSQGAGFDLRIQKVDDPS